MTKRLVKLRGTENFRRVENRKAQPKAGGGGGVTIGGPLWLSCNPSPFEQTIRRPMNVRFIHITNANTGGMVMGGFALGIAGGAIGGLPGALVGVGIGAGMGSFDLTSTSYNLQVPQSFKRISFDKIKIPCPMKDPLSFKEPTFQEFWSQQYKERQRKRKKRGAI